MIVLTCRGCEYHMTGKEMANSDNPKHVIKAEGTWTYDHFCVGVKSGRRKIKGAADFDGYEWPKWCPKREENNR